MIDGLDAEQEGNARIVVGVATSSGLFTGADIRSAAIIAIATCIVESGIHNLDYGDLDSLGLFQQRASWGSEAERQDPVYASTAFYTALSGLDWQSMPPGEAAQAVQISAFPDRYAEQIEFATAIVDAIGTGTPPTDPGSGDSVRVKTVRMFGNQLVAFMTDGTKEYGVPTNTHGLYLFGGSGGTGPVDPGEGGEGFIMPFDPDSYDAADPFGASPGAVRNHFGSDWPMPENSPIRAIANGTLVNKDYEPGNGNHATFYYGVHNGREIYAGHIHLFELPAYDVGTTVVKGQADILRSGNTGSNSHGAHLHITMSSSEGAWEGVGGIFDPHHFILTGEFIDRNW